MRDPDRIDPVLATLAEAWKANPGWRLGQLIANAAREDGAGTDVFYLEDDRMHDALTRIAWGDGSW